MALARLGMSVDDFLDITPLELSLALEEDADYRFAFDKQQMHLLRYIGVIVRNRGLKASDQIRDPKEFYPLWWEYTTKIEAEFLSDHDWSRLDGRYIHKNTN